MSVPTADDFRDTLGEFTAFEYPDEVVERWIAQARKIYNKRSLGIIYLTAHLITIANTERAAEDTPAMPDNNRRTTHSQRETVGPLSVTYSQQSGTFTSNNVREPAREFYEETTYGRMFLELKVHTSSINMPRIFG